MKKYFITTIVPGAKLNINFMDAVASYCKINKAEVLFIPSAKTRKEDEVDENHNWYGKLVERNDHKLNNNLLLSLIPISPTQPDPIQGLERISNKEHSVIYASPKQRLKSVASPSLVLPRVIMTPGACTNPYAKATRAGMISNMDHVMGGIIVEVVSNTIYHFRQVQADRFGHFVDMGVKYLQKDRTVKMKTAAIIAGDWHSGYTDPVVRKATVDMLGFFKPNDLILHDFFDGISVNHHIDHKFILKAMMGEQNNLSSELQMTAVELSVLANKAKNIKIVKSNHDEFLDKWLEEGKYLEDTTNHIIGLELALAKARGQDPLQYGLSKYQNFKNVTFLKTDESYKLTPKGIECGAHGHLGANGARGSNSGMEKAYTNSVTGHSHSPEIQRGAWTVGTSSYLKLNYNRGPSSWMQTHCIVYENGSRQLINMIQGKWHG